MIRKILFAFIGCTFLAGIAQAAELLYWDTFPIEKGVEGPTTYDSTFEADGVEASVLALGPGITPRADNDTGRFQGENFNSTTLEGALADGDYFEFDITPSAGSAIDASELMVTLRNRGGSTEERTISIVSSQDNFSAPVATFLLPAGNSTSTSQPVTVDISGLDLITETTTVRIVAYFASGFDDSKTHPLTIGYVSDNELTTSRALLISGEVVANNLWLGYTVDEAGWVDTGAWMGLLNVTHDPWLWSDTLGKYIYLGDESGWIFVPAS